MDNFSVVSTFVTLCRSDYYSTFDAVMNRMVVLFPEYDRESLEEELRPAIKSLLKNWYP